MLTLRSVTSQESWEGAPRLFFFLAERGPVLDKH